MILKGDCIKVMKAVKPNSVDAIVCDPPYGLEFMGKNWDRLWNKHENDETRSEGRKARKFQTPSPQYKAGLEMQLWHTQWLTEAYRVLKPGASMLVMGGTRTFHRLACAIEDSGFIIKDTLMYLYGSGFPKAQDLGKMIDKRARRQYVRVAIELGLYIPDNSKWDWTKGEHGISDKWWEKFKSFLSLEDWQRIERKIIGNGTSGKTAIWNEKGKMGDFDITAPSTLLAKHWDGFKVGGIKPAYEPIIWAVKPPEGSYVDNVLKWGVGAVNVDECRISHDEFIRIKKKQYDSSLKNPKCMQAGRYKDTTELKSSGRFPANVILSHHPECVQVGVKKVRGAWSNKGIVKNKRIFNANLGQNIPVNKDKYYDPDGYETVESWDCHPDCAVRLLDEQSGVRQSKWGKDAPDKLSGNINYVGKNRASQQQFRGDSGGASRFFKQCNYGQEEWLCHENCALRQLDEQSGILKSGANPERRNSAKTKTCYGEFEGQKECISYRGQNSGGASRFFYCAKASRGERNAGLEGYREFKDLPNSSLNKDSINPNLKGRKANPIDCVTQNRKLQKTANNHPTVKPIKLFEWLIKLVTREGQIILDPFIGSGTTAIAAHNVGRKCVGIEKESEYLNIANGRIAYWRSRPRQLEII